MSSAADLADRAKGTFLVFVSICLGFAFVLTAAETGTAQDSAVKQAENLATLPKFEIATIKPVAPGTQQMMGVTVYPGGRVVIRSLTLRSLVGVAFNLSGWQMSGGDPWTEKDEYNVEAKPPENSQIVFNLRHTWFGIEDEHLRQMLQALLMERFQLKLHRKTLALPAKTRCDPVNSISREAASAT
jgi:hypothetical protein